jgi:hypothetical protein
MKVIVDHFNGLREATDTLFVPSPLTIAGHEALWKAMHVPKFCKLLRSPGIESKESLPTAFVA